MSNTDGPAALRRIADGLAQADASFVADADELQSRATEWQAEREQAAADRAALDSAMSLTESLSWACEGHERNLIKALHRAECAEAALEQARALADRWRSSPFPARRTAADELAAALSGGAR